MTECETDKNKDQLKHSRGRGEYTTCCTMKEESGIAWFYLRIWKLKGGKGGKRVGRSLLCAGEESVSYLLLICPEIQRCSEELLKNKWSHIYKETAIRKILTLKNATELRKLGTSSHSVKSKLKNLVEKAERGGGGLE